MGTPLTTIRDYKKEDFDTIVENGIYCAYTGYGNSPAEGSSVRVILVVLNARDNIIAQIVLRFDTNTYFIRTRHPSLGWSEWKQIATTDV